MNINMQELTQYLIIAMTVIGALAFITAVIVQAIKEQPGLDKIPTSLVALIVAEIVTIIAMFSGFSYLNIAVMWYFAVGAIIAGFIVYMIATGGWDKLHTIWEKTKFQEGTLR